MSLDWSSQQWWKALKVQHKVWAVLLFVGVPLVGGLAAHLYVVKDLLAIQEQRQDLLLARQQVDSLRRLAIDIEDAFRGYVLTNDSVFLNPLIEAEKKLGTSFLQTRQALAAVPSPQLTINPIEQQLRELLGSKHRLIESIQQGHPEQAVAYVRSGQGLQLSDALRRELRRIEDQLESQVAMLNDHAGRLSRETFYGLWLALAGVLGLGGAGSVILARSVTKPLAQLRSITTSVGTGAISSTARDKAASLVQSHDEIGQLAATYIDMAERIDTHVQELEALNLIGQEINTIGPDGLEGVLRRITDRTVELVKADVCLVLLRHEQMDAWVVEAASGEWDDRLKKSVMLLEELPVSAQAYDSGSLATGNRLRSDPRPQVLRRNLIGDSMLAIPLLSQGAPFGVLALLSNAPRESHEWNHKLASGMAQEAAIAISNVRLFQAVQDKQQGLLARLHQLEHLAETLAHDLKGPGARMEELAELLAKKFSGQLDGRTARWLALIQENGRDIVRRVEGILSVARVGTGQGPVSAVDPRLVIDEVLKSQAEHIEQLHAIIHVEPGFPLVACHRAYLRQVFDNLLSNALKYAQPGGPPSVTISSHTGKHMVCFTIRDQGIGIPAGQRSRVFQPFVRLEQTGAPGSGIGLAIVQRIVALYGGRIWIEGTEPEGCTIKFTIPWLNQDYMLPVDAMRGTADPEAVNVSLDDFA